MESSNFKFELVKHFINRKVIQELLQLRNIQTIQKTPLIMSDIAQKFKEKEEKLIYAIMKKELSDAFSDFRYLARGAQGYVILAKEKQTNKRFAIKGCFVRDDEGEVENEQELKDAKKEIEILSQCRGSPYVSNLIKSIDLETNQFVYLVFTEYQGTLQELIDNTQDKKLNEISAIKYSKDIAEGLLHIHNKGYLVNDLKMDNILIDYNGNAVVSDFGYAQRLKKNQGYAYYEYQGNIYFQAPECVDPEALKLYEDEYKKLGVETQVNPSQRSEACSFGYLIYTMVQGKKQAYHFIHEKHKPLVYDDNFKSFKYSKQLQQIIDGLTKFIPKERLSIKEAFEQLKEIMSIEFNLDQKFQILVSEQTQQQSQNQLKEIEFIETFDKKYYPIVKNEDSFVKELVSEKDFSNEQLNKPEQLQNENKSQQQDQENLIKSFQERENQIKELLTASQKNLQEKEQQIMDLNGKLQSNDQKLENLKNYLENIQNYNLSLQQKQDSLEVDLQKKDQHILQIEEKMLTLRRENEKLKQKNLDLNTQKKFFLVNQERAQKEILQLKQTIKDNLDREQKKIQELEEKINSEGVQQDNVNQFEQLKSKIKKDIITPKMKSQQNPNQMFQGEFNQNVSMSECQCKMNEKCEKECAKCGHKFCDKLIHELPGWEDCEWQINCYEGSRTECGGGCCGGPYREVCCKCNADSLGRACTLGCKCEYCTYSWWNQYTDIIHE